MSQSSNVPSLSHKLPWGKRKEYICLVHIEELIELHPGRPIDHVLQETAAKYSIPKSTLHNWYSHYKKYGEYPYETKAARKKLRKLYKKCTYTNIVTHAIVEAVGAIIEEHPEFFLDEIQQALAKNKKTLLSLSTIHRILTEKLGLSLQVCYESAKQRNEVERLRYKRALETLVSDPAQLVFVDETHKDRRASRRRRAWGKRNSGGVALKRWFKNTVRYTMIAALDINGFIAETIDCVIRDEISSEGAAGTVNADYFESWVENFLCPTLGNFLKAEPRSIVVMDNASTHMDSRVADMIRATGAYLLYTAPYSPDLNPIELAFNIYKNHLKRNEIAFEYDWYRTHMAAFQSINRDICIKEFRRCEVPLSNQILTTVEEEELASNLIVALTVNQLL